MIRLTTMGRATIRRLGIRSSSAFAIAHKQRPIPAPAIRDRAIFIRSSPTISASPYILWETIPICIRTDSPFWIHLQSDQPCLTHIPGILFVCFAGFGRKSLSMPASHEYDAVIVGAGPNGLAGAIRMAQQGFSTLVLE